MVAFLIVAVLSGGIAGLVALILGFSSWIAVLIYVGAGVASLALVLLRAFICDVLSRSATFGPRDPSRSENS